MNEQEKQQMLMDRIGRIVRTVAVLIILAGLVYYFIAPQETETPVAQTVSAEELTVSFQNDALSEPTCHVYADRMPFYEEEDVLVLNDNRPNFTMQDLKELTTQTFSPLDAQGRCGSATALLDATMMPLSEREGIGDVRPTGFQTVKYPDLIEDGYLYNRCHLIAYALTGENANELNLVTGTRHLNKDLMLPYEVEVIRYLEAAPENKVLYRVTPYFYGKEMVCRGIEMEAYSVTDGGNGLSFHVFLYNVQPGVEIDYATGESTAS